MVLRWTDTFFIHPDQSRVCAFCLWWVYCPH